MPENDNDGRLQRTGAARMLAADPDLNIDEPTARLVLERIFDPHDGIIANELRDQNKVVFLGFGTFYAGRVRGRDIHHPRTGDIVSVPERLYPRWTPSYTLKHELRNVEL